MKCPKCHYLGFETGDRCKNCGYDFSLLPIGEGGAGDYEIHPPAEDDVPVHVIDALDASAIDQADPWLGADRDDPLGGKTNVEPTSRDAVDDALTLSLAPEAPLHAFVDSHPDDDLDDPRDDLGARVEELDEPALAPSVDVVVAPLSPVVPFASTAALRAETTPEDLPLFTPPSREDEDDQPLITLPATPRAPLAVRRTPDTPRLRAVPTRRSVAEGGPRPMPRPAPAPVLQFSDDLPERSEPAVERDQAVAAARRATDGLPGSPGARVLAVAIDYLILVGIDVGVVYFTLRMAGLSPGDWKLLPAAPLLTFLALLKVAYFYAFTAVGGQTIGKMAAGTCVITNDGRHVDSAAAMRRTVAGMLSFLLLGLGFVPALFGDHRALHDRLAGTRVVRLRSA